MFDTVLPIGDLWLVLLRLLVSISALSYGQRMLRRGRRNTGWLSISLAAWLFMGGVGEGYAGMSTPATVWVVGLYVILFALFGRLALRKPHGEDQGEAHD